jgi:hypothetical protein
MYVQSLHHFFLEMFVKIFSKKIKSSWKQNLCLVKCFGKLLRARDPKKKIQSKKEYENKRGGSSYPKIMRAGAKSRERDKLGTG